MARGQVRWLVAAAALALLTAVAACGSQSAQPATGTASTAPAAAPTADQAAGRRLAEAPGLLVQCGLDRGTIKASDVPASVADNGQIKPATAGSAAFVQWYASGVDGTTIGGQNLTYWASWAATHDKLPPAVCGASASASQMAKRLFPGAPTAWGT
jgi:hypothetical protein